MKDTTPTSEKPTEKRPRKPRAPRADNGSDAPRAVEKTKKGEKPAKPAVKEGRDVKPRSGKPRREHKPKPVNNWKLEGFAVESQEDRARFHGFNLAPSLIHAIRDLGFPYYTLIQTQVLGFTLHDQDAIDRAQTGTGKTAALLISVITQLLQTPPPKEHYTDEPRALIITPTHELMIQITKDAAALIKYTGLNVMTFVDGMDFDRQLKQLEARFCDILVVAPGRLLDFNQRGEVHLDMAEMMVLDEADRVLDIGFIPQVRQIVRQTPHKDERQTLLFSATLTDDVTNLAKQWTVDPAIVEIEPESVTSDTVEQHVYTMTGSNKYKLLYNLMAQNNWGRVMIFASRKDEVRRIEGRLTKNGISAAQISGGVSQHKHIRILGGFREGRIRVLVAASVADHGIRIDNINHVINFTLPRDPDDYVHRVDHTDRTDASDISISFADENDAFALPSIEELLGRKITCEMPPAELLKPVPRKR